MSRRRSETSKRLGLMAELATGGVRDKMVLLTEGEQARTMELAKEEKEESCTSS